MAAVVILAAVGPRVATLRRWFAASAGIIAVVHQDK